MDNAVKSRPSHYDLFGLTPGASGDEITQAFARELSALRPRPFGSLAEITVAYETLRDPIKRILSHWMHATGAGYETREMVPVLSDPDNQYTNRSRYWMQLQPYLERFDRAQIEVIT